MPALCDETGQNISKQKPTEAMSHISGVKKPLCHTNSLTKLPTYGVETAYEVELGKVSAFFLIIYYVY